MKKILIATTALVATAGMASADITITGKANAGYYSGLSNKDATAAVAYNWADATGTAAQIAAQRALLATAVAADTAAKAALVANAADGSLTDGDYVTAAAAAVQLADETAALDAIDGTQAVAASAGTYTESGIYSNAGIVATMTGATDGGITFSTSVDAEAGTEIDTGDFELDGAASGQFALGAVSVTGGFGTITFDDGGIDNLYDDDLTAADVSYATTVGAVSLTVAANAQTAAGDNTSIKAGYTAGAMTFTAITSDSATGQSVSAAVSYVVSDNFTVRADSDSPSTGESVQTVGFTTALNGVSIVADTANNSTWDVSLGYTVNGVALSYANDEADAWSASASYALGGGATAAAGINSESSMYAGVSFAF
jgi:outer membrane protein OmpU